MFDDDWILLYFLMLKKKKKKHSRYQKRFYKSLLAVDQQLRDRRLPRMALQEPSSSSWKTLLRSGSDQAMITLTDLNFETFRWLLERFRPLYEQHSPFIDPSALAFPRPRQEKID